jgi:hypothetical protein
MSVFDRGKAGEPEYLVSAVVSVYEADEFLAGCLDDLLAQTIAPFQSQRLRFQKPIRARKP